MLKEEKKELREHTGNRIKGLINILYIRSRLEKDYTLQDIRKEYYQELEKFNLTTTEKKVLYETNVYRYWYTHFRNKKINASKQSKLFSL